MGEVGPGRPTAFPSLSLTVSLAPPDTDGTDCQVDGTIDDGTSGGHASDTLNGSQQNTPSFKMTIFRISPDNIEDMFGNTITESHIIIVTCELCKALADPGG